MSSQQKSLGLWTLTALVAGNIIGSGIFLLPAALALYGSIGLVAWIATTIGALVLATIFARLGHLCPKTGGPYAYCHEAYGDFVGFQVAYCYWVALWIGNAAVVVALIGYLAVFFPALNTNPMAALIVSLAAIWVFTGINIIGVKAAGRVQLVSTILKFVPLLIVGAGGMFFMHFSRLHAFNISGHSNISAFTATATLALWSFIGLESATIPAGNVINPEKNIPRATMIGTSLAAIMYIFCTVAIMGIIPMHTLAHSSSPFAYAADLMFGKWGDWIVAIGAIIATAGALNGWILLQGQIGMATAQDKLFPKIFAKTSKNGTPIFSLLISSLLMSILIIARYGASLVDQFTFIILLAVLATLIPYLYTSVAEVSLLIKNPEKCNKKRMRQAVILSAIAFVFIIWATIGAGAERVMYAALVLFSSIPLYILIQWQNNKNQKEDETN
ncbi:MAG: amino acid permease [Gammaproteobacteria bacterium]|nr:amino acid permease [Gammaproteobacteria bacterium]